ncbi:SHOCT domain-containing protein [Haladaptatus salinisoli]|uniref:SHOCT domain-containing protein n=1 Tax=Haladaptatus salinisoli TaxID=2884876 RepID=UPI001D0B0AF9|nr:SHOCT domain-containing protein [Haladaptatus salinisoli]
MARTETDSVLRTVLIVLAFILLFPMLMMVFAVPMMGMMGWWGGAGAQVGISPLWGVGMMLLFLLILAGLGYLLFKSIADGSLSSQDRALEELRVAYARGELTDDEYEQRRDALRRSE